MKRKIELQFNGMIRIPKLKHKELNQKFKNKSVSELEMQMKEIITKSNLSSEFYPKRRFPFIYYYKIKKIEIIMIFLHDWRIWGIINEQGIAEIRDLSPSEEKYLKKFIELVKKEE